MPPPGTSDVAQQHLQDGRGANDLHALGVLGPAHGVADGGRFIGAGGGDEGFRRFQECVPGHAAVALDGFRRVAREMALQDLEDAARMLQGAILVLLGFFLDLAAAIVAVSAAGRAAQTMSGAGGMVRGAGIGGLGLGSFVQPGAGIVLVLQLVVDVQAGEDAVQVFGVLEFLANDGGGVGVVDHVIVEVAVVLQDVVDDGAEEENVAAGAQRDPDIGHGRGAGEARVDVDDPGAALARRHYPLKSDRVLLRHGGAHDHDGVSVVQALLRGGGAAAAERGAQTGHRGAVSYTGLVADAVHAQAGGE